MSYLQIDNCLYMFFASAFKMQVLILISYQPNNFKCLSESGPRWQALSSAFL